MTKNNIRVIVTVSGPTGSGKSRLLHEIRIALQAVGVSCSYVCADDRRAVESESWGEQSGGWQPDLPSEVILQEINTPISMEEGLKRLKQ